MNATDPHDPYDPYDSFYSYDYSPMFSNFIRPSTLRKIYLPMFSISFVVGLAGNILVIYAVVKSKRLHNAPCLLLANLAVADILSIIVLIPLLLTLWLVLHTRDWTLGDAMCRLIYYSLITPPVCSIFTMLAISIERYYVVFHPLKAKSFVTMGRVKKVIIGIWVTSCILTIPAFFDRKVHTSTYYSEDGQEETFRDCNDGWPNQRFIIAYTVYLFLLVFFIPSIIVSYIYIRIGFHLNRTLKAVGNSKDLPGWSSGSCITTETQNVTSEEETEMDTLQSSPSRTEDDSSAPRRHQTSNEGDNMQGVIRMLAVVVAVFILTWGPLMTSLLVLIFNPDWFYISFVLTPFTNLLAAFNSCINPIIYAFLSKTFRRSFKEVIRGCCCCTPLRNNVV